MHARLYAHLLHCAFLDSGDDISGCIYTIQESKKNQEESLETRRLQRIREQVDGMELDDQPEPPEPIQDCFTFAQQRAIIAGVMSAVEYLEKHGLIHCDIKPQNVMFNV